MRFDIGWSRLARFPPLRIESRSTRSARSGKVVWHPASAELGAAVLHKRCFPEPLFAHLHVTHLPGADGAEEAWVTGVTKLRR